MIGASKILTVSYGTFSCTLEGFEEPFSTMKAIAEYFRDLAADDRYFGAEPPTPDAEMLHRIAEREIQRRVEAKINVNGVVLRAEVLAAPMAEPVAKPEAEPVAEPVAVTTEPAEMVAALAAAPETVVAPAEPMVEPTMAALDPQPVAEAETVVLAMLSAEPEAVPVAEAVVDFVTRDSVVAKLSRLRAAAALARGDAGEPAAPVLLRIYAEDLYVEDLYAAPAYVEPALRADSAAMADDDSDMVAQPVDASVADAWAAFDLPQDGAAALSDPAADAAADLMDLSQLGQGSDTAGEPEHTAAEQLAPVLADAPQNETPDLGIVEDADASVAAVMDALDAGADAAAMAADMSEGDAATAEGVASDEPESAPLADEMPADQMPVAFDDGEAEPLAAAETPVAEAQRRPRARVIKVLRADVIAATDAKAAEAGTTDQPKPSVSLAEMAEQDPILANLAATMADSGLSDEDQSDLLRELADVTRELEADGQAVAGAPAEARDEAPDTDAAIGALLQDSLAGDDSAVSVAETTADPEMAAVLMPEAEDRIADLMADMPQDDVLHEDGPQPDGPQQDGPQDIAGIMVDAGTDMGAASLLPVTSEPADDGLAAAGTAAAETAAEIDLPQDEVPDAEPELRISEGRAILETETEPHEDAISRLFDQTNSELQGTENRRRLSAIAHLKAAVAATEADKDARSESGESQNPPSEMDRYRADLAQVVRPRRPETTAMPTRRPVMTQDRMAPLVLVSEQRIDRPTSVDSSMIRPRRVMATALALNDEDFADEDWEDDGSDEAILSDSSSFAEFAERIGASGLSDLLEAAAAYAAYVEGRPSFSRPQIMKKIAGFSPDDAFSREDGLRSFGMLLRQGKIQKVRRGQFAIAKTSRFIPEARRMAP